MFCQLSAEEEAVLLGVRLSRCSTAQKQCEVLGEELLLELEEHLRLSEDNGTVSADIAESRTIF